MEGFLKGKMEAAFLYNRNQRRIREAEEKCGRYLAGANAAEERGAKKTAERLFEKSGFWRDRMNKLSGDA